MLTIITVVYNDIVNLKRTVNSIDDLKSVSNYDFEYIVIDGGSTDGSLDYIKSNKTIDKFISEPDSGIYDAMNKGISLSSGKHLIFINAGDFIVGDILEGHFDLKDNMIYYLDVYYFDFFKRLSKVKIRSKYVCLPNCHQGIIFPKSNITYDTNISINADYDFFLKHLNQKFSIEKIDNKAFVYFDPGFSANDIWRRDSEIFRIKIQYFGLVFATISQIPIFSKYLIRRCVNTLRKFF